MNKLPNVLNFENELAFTLKHLKDHSPYHGLTPTEKNMIEIAFMRGVIFGSGNTPQRDEDLVKDVPF